jgi:FdhD protein
MPTGEQMNDPQQPETPLRYTSTGWKAGPEQVIREENVTLTVNGEEWVTFACTPTQLEALGAGFLFNEGIIQQAGQIASLRTCDNGCNIDIWLTMKAQKPTQWRRTSGCTGGITGIQSSLPIPAICDQDQIDPQVILQGMEQMLQSQELYRAVRGVHCSALSDGNTLVCKAEDIGRHNTLDKLAGLILLNPIPLPRRMILTTGRISSEMLQKSARLGAAYVISRTSPTALSVTLALEAGITLVGYVRHTEFIVYAHSERILIQVPRPA